MLFDYYILSFSYAPDFCLLNPDKRNSPECTGGYGLVLHGLWPQYRDGTYPQFCEYKEKYTKSELDIIIKGIPGWERIAPEYMDLVCHEWIKHGTCSGLNPKDYFEFVFRTAQKYIKDIPSDCSDIPSLFSGDIYHVLYDTSNNFSGVEIKIDLSGNAMKW